MIVRINPAEKSYTSIMRAGDLFEAAKEGMG
jgi:hypothetical protein